MSIEQWNDEFGIAGQLRFVEGAGGLPFVEISNENANATVSVYAGQVLSYQPVNETADLLFLSEHAYYQPGKAIKGGAPVCWPWFGPDPEGQGRPAHGFVRNRQWNVLSTAASSAGETKLTLGLQDTDETREIWPNSFELQLEITVGAALTLELITRNLGDQAFSITQALHTYFKVGDISQVQVLGLEGDTYLDKVDGGAEKKQSAAVTVAGEVDRIYTNVQPELVIDDGALGRRIRIASAGSLTAVVWNPWSEICTNMADLADDAYQQFICVETANAAEEVVEIQPGSEHRLLASYGVQKELKV
jgi:glucose-6-phosphate 1-epimerase